MNIKNIKHIAAIFCLSLGLTSCLDLEPQDQLSEKNLWSNVDDYKLFANQFYGWSRDFTAAQAYASNKPNHSDYLSDLFTNKDDRNLYSNGTNTVQESDGNYGSNYGHIYRTNILLQKAENFSTPNCIKQYVGEAHFFRAYSYFDLVQLYGDAIIVKEPMQVDDPRVKVAQNDRSEVVDFILDDLDKASTELPSFSDLSSSGYSRLSKEAAWAFISRVALYEGTWQKFRGNEERGKLLLDVAATAAKKVINSKSFSLFQPKELGDSAQKYMFILEDTKSNPAGINKSANHEYIFAKCHDEILYPVGTNLTKANLINAVWVTRKFANMYLCSDGLPIEYSSKFNGYDKIDSEFDNRDNRMRYTLCRPHGNFWNNIKSHTTWDSKKDEAGAAFKNLLPTTGTGYNNQKWCAERQVADKNEGYDFPVIRYAEVLLNYAEAVYERDGFISNEDLNISLNLVRCRVNQKMPKLSNELIAEHPGMDMRTEIRRERTIELFHEGFRLDDLKRWKTAETEMPMNLLGVKWKGTEYEKKVWPKCPYSPNADGCIIIESGRKWSEKNYLFPLPKDQLQLNPQLKQNPGWE